MNLKIVAVCGKGSKHISTSVAIESSGMLEPVYKQLLEHGFKVVGDLLVREIVTPSGGPDLQTAKLFAQQVHKYLLDNFYSEKEQYESSFAQSEFLIPERLGRFVLKINEPGQGDNWIYKWMVPLEV